MRQKRQVPQPQQVEWSPSVLDYLRVWRDFIFRRGRNRRWRLLGLAIFLLLGLSLATSA